MNTSDEIEIARRVLAELAEMTEHASLTHSLRGGEKSAVQAYNRVLSTLGAAGHVPQGMFEPLAAEGAEYGEIGVQCRLLMAVTGKKKPKAKDDESMGAVIALAPFLDSNDLAQMVRERMGSLDGMPDGFLVALAPFLDSSMLGDLVRRNMKVPPAPPTAPVPPVAPTPSIEAAPSAPDFRPVVHAPTTLESLADELRRPDLTMEERQRIATQLAELSYAQAVQATE